MKLSKSSPMVIGAVAGVAGLTVVAGLGMAFGAAWTANASGNAKATAGQINFTANATISTVATTNPVHPGSIAGVTTGDTTGGDMTVHIVNTSGFSIKVVAIQQYGLATVATAGIGTCSADTGTAGSAGTATTAATPPTADTGAANPSGVWVGTTQTGGAGVGYFYQLATPITVASAANLDVTIPNALSMSSSSAQTGCQTAVFSIPVQVQAQTL